MGAGREDSVEVPVQVRETNSGGLSSLRLSASFCGVKVFVCMEQRSEASQAPHLSHHPTQPFKYSRRFPCHSPARIKQILQRRNRYEELRICSGSSLSVNPSKLLFFVPIPGVPNLTRAGFFCDRDHEEARFQMTQRIRISSTGCPLPCDLVGTLDFTLTELSQCHTVQAAIAAQPSRCPNRLPPQSKLVRLTGTRRSEGPRPPS